MNVLKDKYMKSLLRVVLVLLMVLSSAYQIQASDGLETEEKQHIRNFINLIKENNPEKIAPNVDYPLKRFNPAPDINNEAEFIEKYDMLFDDYLKDMIIKSNLEKDWKRVGWRGYMLYDGIIWLAPDNYKLKAINYTSDKEEAYQQRMLEKSQKALHPSIKDFAHPTLSFKTDNFIIRVDEMGQENYRYASWNKNKSTLDEPDIVIHDGIRHFYGSGGNHDYLFKKGNYVYVVQVDAFCHRGENCFKLFVYEFDQPVKDLKMISEDLCCNEGNERTPILSEKSLAK